MTAPVALASAGGGALADPAESGAYRTQGRGGRPKLEKASLTLYDPTPAGGGGKPGAKRGAVTFQFNPKEVTIAKTAEWKREQATKAPKAGPPQFTGAGPCKLTVEMFFDATGSQDGSVVSTVEQLFSCCVPTEESAGQDHPSPPLVVLHWGAISSFPAFVTSVSAKYTLFNGQGLPIRAVVSVAMEEMPGEAFRQNPTSGSQHVRRVHRTVAGDTLASVAYAEYGDPAQWRALAAYNGIDDPMRVGTGTTLLLPVPGELAGRR